MRGLSDLGSFMTLGQDLPDQARALRAKANEQPTAEAASALRARAASLEYQATLLEASEPNKPSGRSKSASPE